MIANLLLGLRVYFYIQLILVIILKLSNGVSITIHNLHRIETINSSEPLILTLHFEKPELLRFGSINSSKLCITVNGVICNCDYGNDGLYIEPRCLPIDWRKIWLSVIIIEGDTHTATRPIIVRNRAVSTGMNDDGGLSETRSSSKITLVLPLTLDDISRFLILINSLCKISDNEVEELLIFVPDNQFNILNSTIQGASSPVRFPCKVFSEQILFDGKYHIKPTTFTYGLQMAIKLLAAKMVTTDFYLTLDADVVLLQSFTLAQIVHGMRAIYENEQRSVHPHWWVGSEKFLHVPSFDQEEIGVDDADGRGFGVTPSLLSTYGSLLTIGKIQQLYCSSENPTTHVTTTARGETLTSSSNAVNDCSSFLDHWIDGFGHGGVVWSEYTLYRVVLDYFKVFHELHVEQSSPEIEHPYLLHCADIWFSDAPGWDPTLAIQSGCLFSVVQSTAAIRASTILHTCQKNGLF